MTQSNSNSEIPTDLTAQPLLTWLTSNGATWIAAYMANKPFALNWEQLKLVDLNLAKNLSNAGIGGNRTPQAWLNNPDLLDTRGASVYNQNIPFAIKTLGPEAIREFKEGKHWSHQTSYSQGIKEGIAKESLADASNGIFENARDNIKRGAENMHSGWGTENNPGKLKIEFFNELEALKMVCQEVAINAAKGFTAGFLYELVLSALEQSLAVIRKEISLEVAASIVLKKAAIVGLKGAAVAALITGLCVYIPGMGLILSSIAPILAIMGTVATLRRVYDILLKHIQILGYPSPVDFCAIIYQSSAEGIKEGIQHLKTSPWDFLGSGVASSQASLAEYQSLQNELDDLLA